MDKLTAQFCSNVYICKKIFILIMFTYLSTCFIFNKVKSILHAYNISKILKSSGLIHHCPAIFFLLLFVIISSTTPYSAMSFFTQSIFFSAVLCSPPDLHSYPSLFWSILSSQYIAILKEIPRADLY